MKEVKLYKKRQKAIKTTAVSVLFVAVGIWMLQKSNIASFDYVLALLCIILFGIGFFVGLFQIFDNRPQIVIDETGVWDRSTKQEKIKWKQIKKAYSLDVFKQQFVPLELDKTFKFNEKKSNWDEQLSKEVGGQDINLLVSNLKIDEHKMADFINEIIQANAAERQAIIEKYFPV